MGYTWSDLKNKSDDEIIKEHDDMLASGLPVGVDYFVAEIYHRRQSRLTRIMLYLTVIITVLTIVNVAVAIAMWKQLV